MGDNNQKRRDQVQGHKNQPKKKIEIYRQNHETSPYNNTKTLEDSSCTTTYRN
jgi:hypothetical protein